MLKRKVIKQFIIVFLTLLVFNSCKEKTSSKTSLDKKSIIENVEVFLNDWHKAASEANFENYFSKMDSISVFIGTDASENWTKNKFQDFSKPYFDDGKAWDFKPLERHIYTNKSGNFIWFDELLDTWMGVCRGSGVIILENNRLKIKHYVLSVTIPNEAIDDIINLKKEKEVTFLKNSSN
jgi:hypothetical protein